MTSKVEDLGFDVGRLTSYLIEQLDLSSGSIELQKFSGGQSNPTYLVQTGNKKFVLRKKPPGELLKSAHAVEREFRVISALQQTKIPVASPILLCEDQEIIGVQFYLMEFVDGTVFWEPQLANLSSTQRSEIYDQMNQLMVELHSVDINAVGLADFGKPGNYFERQFSRWKGQYRASETEKIENMELIMEWLENHLPEDDMQVTLVHGDFRLDNILFDSNSLKIKALLDWELSTLGHPYADLAYQCMQLRMPSEGPLPGLGGLSRKELGIPSEQEYVDKYCERRGIPPIPHWTFYLVFSFFRFASILQGVKKRAQLGNASSKKAMEMGNYVSVLAKMAAELID